MHLCDQLQTTLLSKTLYHELFGTLPMGALNLLLWLDVAIQSA